MKMFSCFYGFLMFKTIKKKKTVALSRLDYFKFSKLDHLHEK